MEWSTVPRPRLEDVEQICKQIGQLKVGLVGDLCIDLYWRADMRKSRLSRETPHHPLPVVSEQVQLGAGGNVLANLAALRPAALYAAGIVGNDWRAELLLQQMHRIRVSTQAIVRQKGSMTAAYAKPIRCGISDVEYEDPRLDFIGDTITPQVEEQLLAHLAQMAGQVAVLLVADQFANGCITPRIREAVCRLGMQGLPVVVDSRDNIHLYHDVMIKPNEVEGMRAFRRLTGEKPVQEELEGQFALAEVLARQTGCGICLTLGSQGSVQIANGQYTHCPGYNVAGPIDFCGAGDSFFSAFSLALAAGCPPGDAAAFASLASEVTIQKLGTTGTATQQEIQAWLRESEALQDADGKQFF